MGELNILVLGGSGFLGSHVCDKLSEAGHKVRVFDQVKFPWMHSDQEMIVGDLLDEAMLAKAIEGCDAVTTLRQLQIWKRLWTSPLKQPR